MSKALVVGINHYKYFSPLYGCVSDANAVAALLAKHEDNSKNFDVRKLVGSSARQPVTRARLKAEVEELFTGTEVETALFYFAGHGFISSTGGYLVTSDCQDPDAGLPLNEILTLAHSPKVKNSVLVFDSCNAGGAGAVPTQTSVSELKEGMTILTASTANQYANENEQGGVFTQLFLDGLRGGAANLLGDVTPGSLYAHIDQSLGDWQQRPVFKTNVQRFISLRRATPPIKLSELHQLPVLFPKPGFEFKLDPSFEPTSDAPKEKNTAKFAVLQNYVKVSLVVPVGTEHMYYAAMEKKSCKLTYLGEHYRRLVLEGRI